MRQVWTRAALDLRKVGLAQAAANLALHGCREFLLRERTTESAKRTFHRSERAKLVTEFHGRLRNIAICKIYIAICNLSSEIAGPAFDSRNYLSLLKNQMGGRRQLYRGNLPQCF